MLENHMLSREDRRSISEIEERISFLRAKNESLSSLAVTLENLSISAKALGLNQEKIIAFWDYICAELIDADVEEKIETKDLLARMNHEALGDYYFE